MSAPQKQSHNTFGRPLVVGCNIGHKPQPLHVQPQKVKLHIEFILGTVLITLSYGQMFLTSSVPISAVML